MADSLTIPVIGHRITVDAIGIGSIIHPVSCSSVRHHLDCPHWLALREGRVADFGGKRGTYVGVLVDDHADDDDDGDNASPSTERLHLRPLGHPASDIEAREILAPLDCYRDEVGNDGLALDVVFAWAARGRRS